MHSFSGPSNLSLDLCPCPPLRFRSSSTTAFIWLSTMHLCVAVLGIPLIGTVPTWLQVFPGAWTAILVFLDNAGIWNLRVQNLDTWYLGQEVYINVVNPEDSSTTLPENAIFCGALSSLQKWASCDFVHVIKFAPQTQVYLFLPVLTWNLALVIFAAENNHIDSNTQKLPQFHNGEKQFLSWFCWHALPFGRYDSTPT